MLSSIFTRRLPVSLGFLASSASLAWAACECGYTEISPAGSNQGQTILFTDLIETDFLHEENVTTNTDWVPQQFTLDQESARGTYGETFTLSNVVTNPITNSAKYSGPGVDGGDPGLTLIVGSELEDGNVPVAEVSSARDDTLYGTYRAGIKLTDVNGTCAAFFWYFNDTQEVDMEFLSREFDYDNDIYPVNLVLQSRLSAETNDASETSTYEVVNLPFNPTTAYHEYRLDVFSNHVVFLADGEVLYTMNGSAVPQEGGRLMLNHWSNGHPKWSGGPPTEDAVMAVSYVKAYFNSTDPQRFSDWENRCTDINAEDATCAIPEVTMDNDDAATFFFSQQENMANNQTVSGQDSAGMVNNAGGAVILSIALLLSGYAMGVL